MAQLKYQLLRSSGINDIPRYLHYLIVLIMTIQTIHLLKAIHYQLTQDHIHSRPTTPSDPPGVFNSDCKNTFFTPLGSTKML